MKRFTETLKWDDAWFRRLSPAAKLLWQWLCDKCDAGGVIDPDLELASFQIGMPITDAAILELGERVTRIADGKIHLPKFVEFQYGTPSRDCKAHRPIFLSLEKHFPEGVGRRGSKGVPNPLEPLQEKDKETDTAKETEKDSSRASATPQQIVAEVKPKPAPALGSDLEALKSKINALKPEWNKPARWGYAEEQHLFGGAAAQLEELTDDDWKLLKAYLGTPMPKGSNYWQPNGRSKLCESFADVWAGVQRWASKGNGPRPMDTPTKPIGFR